METKGGLNNALALIKAEQLGISYEDALRLVTEENKRTEALVAKSIADIARSEASESSD